MSSMLQGPCGRLWSPVVLDLNPGSAYPSQSGLEQVALTSLSLSFLMWVAIVFPSQLMLEFMETVHVKCILWGPAHRKCGLCVN